MTTSSVKPKEFSTVNSLVVSSDKIVFKYLANNYVGVFIADKIGLNFGVLLMTILFTLGIPGVVPTGQILSDSFSEIFSSFLSTLKRSFGLLSNLTIYSS